MLLVLVFLPAGFNLFPFQQQLTTFIFGPLVELWVPYHFSFTTDAAALYLLLFLLGIIAWVGGLLLGRLVRFDAHYAVQAFQWIRLLTVYYLSSRLLVYGFDKVFQAQFYWPEPNVLYTPFGQLQKDILYWSVVGTSYWYSLLVGVAEVIPAILLWFKRTRLLGLLLSLVALLHVLFINIGFDISVKLFTSFLLLLTVWLIGSNWRLLGQLFLQQKAVRPIRAIAHINLALPWRNGLKVLAVGLIMVEALHFPLTTGYWNDNHVARPLFHGAYEIEQPALAMGLHPENEATPIRFFVHRRHFFIVQYANNQWVDFSVQVDTQRQQFHLLSTAFRQAVTLSYHWEAEDSSLTLSRKVGDNTITWHGQTLNWRALPALKDEFHWAVDYY